MIPELINGNWNQTISYQLENIKFLLETGLITPEQLTQAIMSLTGETIVTVINTSFATLQTVYIRQTTPLPQPVKVQHIQEVIRPEPRKVVLQDHQIIRQVCGVYSNAEFFSTCANKVREYINHLQSTGEPRPGQFNIDNTGVRPLYEQYKIEKEQRRSGNPYYQPLNTTDFTYQGAARIPITPKGREILASEQPRGISKKRNKFER
jgi:hypothetical protein